MDTEIINVAFYFLKSHKIRSIFFSILLAGMEEFSDVEDGEEPYYPETERLLVTVTRSGRKVFAPQRLVVDPYIPSDDDDDDGVSIPDDESESDEYSSDGVDDDEEDPEGDYVPSDEDEDMTPSESTSSPSSLSVPLDDDEQDDASE